MLDEIMLDARLLALRENGAEVDRPLAYINHAVVGRTRGILHVHHREALRVTVEEVERIAASEFDPVEIHIEIDERWRGRCQQHVERPLAVVYSEHDSA